MMPLAGRNDVSNQTLAGYPPTGFIAETWPIEGAGKIARTQWNFQLMIGLSHENRKTEYRMVESGKLSVLNSLDPATLIISVFPASPILKAGHFLWWRWDVK
ncbi:hypothetical protein N7539_001959 [Penicillium diatomitis]|uniref:Uncharacterized protein n=1 Tax=Penicillium diatomitis TaxID=2819901 RepID=A0A9W9XHZ6_9EURO|nr:uncharacterized protein N7539_001959 [Penicillium diatomitis]KAJ5493213.1 hypothetical protein N7539_001959 [Penicillium diatomitis]